MEKNRWKVREFSPFDLIQERNLINVFITSPKTSNSRDYSEFKFLKSKLQKRIKYKQQLPINKNQKVVKYEGPRLNQNLPEPIKLPVLRSQAKTQSPKTSKAELYIEDLIRNRQEITIPSFEDKKSPMNFREKFIKTRSELLEDLQPVDSALLKSVKHSFKSGYNAESEMTYWNKQPFRKWDKRRNRVVNQSKFQTANRSFSNVNQSLFEDEVKEHSDNIKSIFEACGENIMNWPLD